MSESRGAKPVADHRVHCVIAAPITHEVSGVIRSPISASRTNSSGGTMPCRGWGQRTSASMPDTVPEAKCTLGW